MIPDLERLIQLQRVDREVDTRRKVLADLPSVLEALDQRVTDRQADIATARHALSESQTARRAIEKDLAVVQGRLTKYKDQLMEVKTNKEYVAMQHEIAMAQEGVSGFEDKILELLVQSDEQESAIKSAEQRLKDEQQKVGEERRLHEQGAVKLQKELDALMEERTRILGELTPASIALFDHVAKQRKGYAVAEVRDGHCMACQVRLRPQIVNEVRRGDRLLQCDSCQRILFVFPTPPATAQPGASTNAAQPASASSSSTR